jgi:hypothetical protein
MLLLITEEYSNYYNQYCHTLSHVKKVKDNSNKKYNNDKLILQLNNALAMENAAIERLKKRHKEASLPEAKK